MLSGGLRADDIALTATAASIRVYVRAVLPTAASAAAAVALLASYTPTQLSASLNATVVGLSALGLAPLVASPGAPPNAPIGRTVEALTGALPEGAAALSGTRGLAVIGLMCLTVAGLALFCSVFARRCLSPGRVAIRARHPRRKQPLRAPRKLEEAAPGSQQIVQGARSGWFTMTVREGDSQASERLVRAATSKRRQWTWPRVRRGRSETGVLIGIGPSPTGRRSLLGRLQSWRTDSAASPTSSSPDRTVAVEPSAIVDEVPTTTTSDAQQLEDQLLETLRSTRFFVPRPEASLDPLPISRGVSLSDSSPRDADSSPVSSEPNSPVGRKRTREGGESPKDSPKDRADRARRANEVALHARTALQMRLEKTPSGSLWLADMKPPARRSALALNLLTTLAEDEQRSKEAAEAADSSLAHAAQAPAEAPAEEGSSSAAFDEDRWV